MTKRQQVAVLGVLGIVIIAVYARAWRLGRAPQSPSGATEAETPVLPKAEPLLGERPVSPERDGQRERTITLDWVRDPFVRGPGGGMTEALNLSGILWDAAQPLAIINGHMLQVGEEVGGFRLTTITEDHVSLTDGQQVLELRIAP